MAMQILFFFPQNLFCGLTGAHQRGLEMLNAFADLGYEVTVFSSTMFTDVPWKWPLSETAEKCKEIIVHEPPFLEASVINAARFVYRAVRRVSGTLTGRIDNVTFRKGVLCPRSMRNEFQEIIERTNPDVVFMSYGYWDGLLDHSRESHRRRIIDTHDLLSVAARMRSMLARAVRDSTPGNRSQSRDMFEEDFFSSCYEVDDNLRTECSIYDKYDVSIAISQKEAEIIQSCVSNTQVATITMTREPVWLDNTYGDAACFAAGDNPYNVHGYRYLCDRVMPKVLSSIPDFKLKVTGPVCKRLTPHPGTELLGVVDRIESVYSSAGFFVNPVFGGTGQQVKIVDAMAHGLPVIALQSASQGSPLRHNENGLIAENACEMADCIIRLWHDRTLCRHFGEEARRTVQNECSPRMLRSALEAAVRGRGPTEA